MLVVGLIVGPAVGLALGRILAGSQMVRGWGRPVGAIIVILAIAVFPVGDIGFRLGFDAGLVLGVLLWATSVPVSNSGTVHALGSGAGAGISTEEGFDL
jgi:hypothetical protein